MSVVCIGVSNKWSNSRTRWDRRGSKGGKKYPHAYFRDENGKFFNKRVSKTEAIRLKLSGIYKKRVFICESCGRKFFGLIRKESDRPACPYCS